MFENLRLSIQTKRPDILTGNEYKFSFLVLSLIFIVSFLSKVQIETNDDIFVYFNYARNTAEGNFFAIDNRNIPGEGFSSLLYMILLVPFHWFSINPMLYGLFLNMVALYVTAIFFQKVIAKLLDLSDIESLFCQSFSFLILILHPNIIGIAGWAFETLYSAMFFAILAWLAINSKKIINYSFKNDLIFIIFYFLGYLIRPENVLIYSPLIVLYSLTNIDGLKSIIKFLALFAFIFLFWTAVKFLIFGDIFPTGYYRKFSNGNGSNTKGLDYLKTWIFTHKKYLTISVFGYFIYYLSFSKSIGGFKVDNKKSLQLRTLQVLFICFLFNCLFVVKTTPLVGYFYRYLIISNTVLILGNLFFVVMAFKLLVPVSVYVKLKYKFLLLVCCIVPIILPISSVLSAKGVAGTLQKLNVIADTDRKLEIHPYIRFGSYLKQNLSFYKSLVLSMGDGGAVPYAADCITIDPAGLTEPYIAKMAKYKGSDKIEKYSKYLLSYSPDIIMLTAGKVGNPGTQEEEIGGENHLPISQDQFLDYLKIVSNRGYVYLGSLKADSHGNGMPYDWHIIIDPNKKTSEELIVVLKKYIDQNGYYKLDHISLAKNQNKVTFKRYALSIQ